jgi:flagellin-like protein
MKGLSPLIGTVLLIAFTIGVGGLISIFATGLTTTSTGITSNQSEALTKCAGAWLDVYSVTNASVLYSNPNSQTITGVVIVYTNGNTQNAADQTLSLGESGVTSPTGGIISSPIVSTSNTTIAVRGLCQSTVLVEGKCTNAQQCWDA